MTDVFTKYFCHYCQIELDGLRIKCASCDNFELCIPCFAARAEIGPHLATHPYMFMNNGDFPLFEEDRSWTAREHMLLLEGVEKYGYGNWKDISFYVETKLSEECKKEYTGHFVTGNLGRLTWKQSSREKVVDHTTISHSPVKVSNPMKNGNSPAEVTLHESIILGYMPNRNDFEVEFENNSEEMLSQMNCVPDDEEIDIALKLVHIDIYKSRLRERDRRKSVIRKYKLVSQFFKEFPGGGKPLSKKKSKIQEYADKFRFLAQIHTVEQYNSLMSDFIKEREICSRIKDLQRFRKNGIKRSGDGVEFEKQRIRRQKRKAERKKNNSEGGCEVKVESPAPIVGTNSPAARADPVDGFSVVGLPGHDLLSANEKKLCAALCLVPAHYISYKSCLLRDHLHKKKGQMPKPLYPVGLDKNHRKKIINFLMHSGWISAY